MNRTEPKTSGKSAEGNEMDVCGYVNDDDIKQVLMYAAVMASHVHRRQRQVRCG